MVYNYLKGFEDFPNIRTELESLGISFITITTIDDVIQVITDIEINHPDFQVTE